MIQKIDDSLYIGNLRGYEDCDLNIQFLSLTHNAIPRGAFKRIEMIDSSSESHFYDQQFVDAIEFMLKASTLVFCDQGGSRAPSVALLYMSVCGDISNASYFDACRKFRTIYPWYKPNTGIRTFLANNWHSLQLSLPHRQP